MIEKAAIDMCVRPFHDWRHNSLTHEAAAGSNPIALMKKAGHSSMATTKLYLHLAGQVFRPEPMRSNSGSSAVEPSTLLT